MSDDIRDVHRYWESLARHDPLWAVLTHPTRKGRKWDLPFFLETGRREISTLFYLLEDKKIAVDRRLALDFGCGVGRVTQALADYFERVVGVDISETMVRLAERLNRHGERVRYILNQVGDLSVFRDAEFSFIYTNIVLQHIPPPAAWKYLAEFWRVLAPGGLLVFQLPSHLSPDPVPAPVVEAMPEDAYRAEIEVQNPPSAPVAVRSSVVLDVVVRNASGHDWSPPAGAALRLGNHWLDAAGTSMLIQDDGRTLLPPSVAAGGECWLRLTMTAPSREGSYTVELDLVHEHVSWFKDKGSAAARFPVEVRAGLAEPSAEPSPAVEAMPEDAYRAEIEVQNPPSAPVAARGSVVLDVVVRNASGHDWSPPAEAPLRLGNHWLDAAGATMLIQDDGRVFLPPSVAAGGECRLRLTMTAPQREGTYTFELDLVHESISWFKDKGSATARFPIEVRAGLGERPLESPAEAPAPHAVPDPAETLEASIYDELPDDTGDPGAVPMYGIPSEEVLAFLDSRGALVLNMEKDESGGREWVGYRYFVRKPEAKADRA